MRRGYLLPTLREYHFVLRPQELTYYKNPCDSVPSGTIPLDQNCWTEPSSSHSRDKVHRFSLVTGERSFELATNEHK
jgi:switch-associated protein 70